MSCAAAQRAMVFVTTLIISLMVSLMFFQDPTKQGTPDCTQECTQMEEGGPEVCEEICTEPAQAKKGPLISIVSALVTTPIVFGLTYLFKWLRKPIVEAVEESAEKRSLGKILKSARAAKKKALEEERARARAEIGGMAQTVDMAPEKVGSMMKEFEG